MLVVVNRSKTGITSIVDPLSYKFQVSSILMNVVSFLFGMGMQAVAAMAWGTETCPKVCEHESEMQEVWNVSSNKRGQA